MRVTFSPLAPLTLLLGCGGAVRIVPPIKMSRMSRARSTRRFVADIISPKTCVDSGRDRPTASEWTR
jgi:hypothetical protein